MLFVYWRSLILHTKSAGVSFTYSIDIIIIKFASLYFLQALIFSLCNLPVLLIGECDSLYTLRDSDWNNQNEKFLANFIINNNLIILNDSTPTRFQRLNLWKSVLDLAVCIQSIAYKLIWTLYQDPGQSGHFSTRCFLTLSRSVR